jgi:DNA-binding GntR family transcriptional regulator
MSHSQASALSPADILSTQDSIVTALQKAILRGELKLGQRILEEDLSEKFGISRATLREALRRLEQLGLVQIKPRKGTYVTKLSLGEIDRICRMRALLEGLAGRYCAENLTEGAISELRGIIDQMRAAADANDHNRFLQADFKFHTLVWKNTEDEQLQHVLRFLSTPYFAFIANVSTHLFTDIRTLCRSHEAYLDILLKRDPDLAQREITAIHQELGRNILRDIVAKEAEMSEFILGIRS